MDSSDPLYEDFFADQSHDQGEGGCISPYDNEAAGASQQPDDAHSNADDFDYHGWADRSDPMNFNYGGTASPMPADRRKQLMEEHSQEFPRAFSQEPGQDQNQPGSSGESENEESLFLPIVKDEEDQDVVMAISKSSAPGSEVAQPALSMNSETSEVEQGGPVRTPSPSSTRQHESIEVTTPPADDSSDFEIIERPAEAQSPQEDVVSRFEDLTANFDNEDSDPNNELMVIEFSEAPLAAQAKWRHQTVAAREARENVAVKVEKQAVAGKKPGLLVPQDNAKKIEKTKKEMRDEQRAMMKNINAQNKASNANTAPQPPPQIRKTATVGSLNLPANSLTYQPAIQQAAQEDELMEDVFEANPVTLEQVDSAMGGVNEDDDWMHASDSDDQDQKFEDQMTELKRQQQQFLNLVTRNLGTEQDRLGLGKITNKLSELKRMHQLRNRGKAPEEESLFIPQVDDDENREEALYTHRANRPRPRRDPKMDAAFEAALEKEFDDSLHPGQQSDEDLGLRKDGKPRKRRAAGTKKGSSRPKNAREVLERQREKDRKKDKSNRERDAAREALGMGKVSKGKGKAISSTKGKGKGRAISESKGKNRAAKTKEIKKGKATKGKGRAKKGVRGRNNQSSSFRIGVQVDPVGEMLVSFADDDISTRITNPIFNADGEEVIVGHQNKDVQFARLFANIPEQSDIGGMGKNARGIREDKKALLEASRAFGFGKVTAQSGKWLMKGMASPLYHHQLLGAQWMVQRELAEFAPNGGILADAMGLGKTIQMLACMVSNPPTTHDIARENKATLIVVPAAIIDQWMTEIPIHCGPKLFPKVMRYKHSVTSQQTIAVLQDADIVITSYSDVMRGLPYPSTKEEREEIQRIGVSAWLIEAKKRFGVLHNINWYRVVLDEAQAIKNNASRTSLACQNLKAMYRWCLSGTPLLNRLEELFPYLRFLKANYSMDWETFKKYFCDNSAEDSYNRIKTLLSYAMMRRTMATTILNRPIITLPKPHPEMVFVELSREEQIIYRITENRFRSNLNLFIQKGTAGANYATFMVQLLRLRQMTSHPFMLERTIKEMWTLEDVQRLQKEFKSLQDEEDEVPVPFYTQIKAWVDQTEAEKEELLARGEDPGDAMVFGLSDFGHAFNMKTALENLNDAKLMERSLCQLCRDVPVDPLKTDCDHFFCSTCITDYLHDIMRNQDFQVCPACNNVFENLAVVEMPAGFAGDDDASSPSRSRKKGKGRKPKHPVNGKTNDELASEGENQCDSKGRDALGYEPRTQNTEWLEQADQGKMPLVASAKTATLKGLLLKAFKEAPTDKVVIYVQFKTLSRILGRMCNAENWGFVYLTGDCTLDHRQKALTKFKADANVRILIAGLKCGGIGLNLAFANRCISLDLWWNHAVESQAFGRIFRIGQEKETHFTRIIVKNTVDTRLLSMQMYKLKALDKAMREGEDLMIPATNLSIQQLVSLFGFLKTDEDGGLIAVEDDARPDGAGAGSEEEIEELADEQFDGRESDSEDSE